ncbi:hypothetical protein DFH09DRAFT_1335696 [Mycena vulgaris]|nr:hypothetical protein DFH09DRAFT_1335696 [Mycena vulgaris]
MTLGVRNLELSDSGLFLPDHPHELKKIKRESGKIQFGYWSWDGPSSGMTLHVRSELGLKGLADVKIRRASPVLACQPPRLLAGVCPPAPPPHSHSHTLPEAPTPDSSFDLSLTLSLISDTSSSTTCSSDNPTSTWPSSPSDTSFTLPPPPTRGLGLGLRGLFNADGAPFDGMGVLSFGCDSGEREQEEREREMERGLSRAFLEEAARTWAADPHHRILSVIVEQGDECEEETQERECEDEVREQEEQERKPRPHGSIRTRNIRRDLSTVDTISSGLKRCVAPAKKTSPSKPKMPAPAQRSKTPAPAPRSKTPAPAPRSKTPAPAPRSPSTARASRAIPCWRA